MPFAVALSTESHPRPESGHTSRHIYNTHINAIIVFYTRYKIYCIVLSIDFELSAEYESEANENTDCAKSCLSISI